MCYRTHIGEGITYRKKGRFKMRATKEYRLGLTEEAKKIVDDLTLEQKVWLMSGNIDITKLSQEDLIAMMGDMASDENHYNVVPYAAGGIEEKNIPPMLFADGPRAEIIRRPVSRYRWQGEPHSIRNLRSR